MDGTSPDAIALIMECADHLLNFDSKRSGIPQYLIDSVTYNQTDVTNMEHKYYFNSTSRASFVLLNVGSIEVYDLIQTIHQLCPAKLKMKTIANTSSIIYGKWISDGQTKLFYRLKPDDELKSLL